MNIEISDNAKNLMDMSEQLDWSTPEFKLKHFVGGSHLHPMHKIQQYLLELNARVDQAEAYEYDVLKWEAEQELERELANESARLSEKKIHEIEVMDLERKIKATRVKINRTKQDIAKFERLIEEFNASEEGRDDNGELYMDILKDPIKMERIEASYWEYRLAKQAAMDMVAYGRIGVGNMDAIMQLDANAQNKCIAMAYEVLMLNEHRINVIQDRVQERLTNGQTVSDICKLVNMGTNTEFMSQLEQAEKVDVPLIQKR